MATEGIEGLYIETRNYGATASFWASMGFENAFETDHGSGQWTHPGGRPVSLQAPVPDGVDTVDAEAHHRAKYGTA